MSRFLKALIFTIFILGFATLFYIVFRPNLAFMSPPEFWYQVDGLALSVNSAEDFGRLRNGLMRTFSLDAGASKFTDPNDLEFTLFRDQEQNALEKFFNFKVLRFEMNLKYDLTSHTHEFRSGWFKVRNGAEYQFTTDKSFIDKRAVYQYVIDWHN